MKTLLFLIMVVISINASARIFESVADCDRRYGKPKLTKGNKRTYTKGGFTILVSIDKGKVEKILYMKTSGENFKGEWVSILRLNAPAGTVFIKKEGKSYEILCDEKTYESITKEGGCYAKVTRDAVFIYTYSSQFTGSQSTSGL